MAGTGLPTGGNGRPVLLQPSPEVRPVAALAQADAWGLTASAAGRASDAAMGVAAQAQEQAKLKWAADFELGARAKRVELQGKYPDDPVGFERDWAAYSDGQLGAVPLAYADHARKTLGFEGLSSLASIQTAALNKQRAMTADSVKARLDVAQTDVLGAAYRGEMSGDQFTQSLMEYRAYLNDGVRAGLWSQDHADLKADELAGKAKAEAIVGRARSSFERMGPEGAYREAEGLLNDPALRLDPREVESYRGRVGAEINKWAGFQSADRQKLGVEAEILKDKFKVGAASADEVTSLVQRATALRDYRTASELTRGFQRQEALGNEAWKPPAATAETIRALQEKARATPAANAAPLADRIIGAESGGRADATNPNSSATGAGQFIASTWLDMVKRNAPDIAAGKSDADLLALRTDPALSRRMVDAYASENRDKLAAQGLPTDDGALYLAHFAGDGGAAAVLKAAATTPIRDILSPSAISANAGMKADGKPFVDWTAGDLRAWATSKVGQTARPAVDPDLIKDMEAANTRKMEALKSDPLGYVSSLRGAPALPTVDWSRPDAAAVALQERQRTAAATSSMFQTGSPAPVLTKPELDTLKATFANGDAGTRARIVGTLGRSLDTNHLRATLEKVAGDDPVFASAGLLYQQSPELGLSVIRGQGWIESDRKILPQDKAIRQAVNDFLGSAVGNMPKSRDAIERAAQARYADLSVAANDRSGALDSTRMEQALRDVTGGVVSWGQGTRFFGLGGVPKIIPPKPGMDDSAFGKLMDGLTDDDLAGAVTAGEKPLRAADLRRLAHLQDNGPGRYTIWFNDGSVKQAGRPDQSFVLDLTGKVK